MALLQISEPGASPDPHTRRHRRRHRSRHDAFARRRGAQRRRRMPARSRRARDPAFGRALPGRRPAPASAARRSPARSSDPEQHASSRSSASWAAASPTSPSAGRLPYDFVDDAGHGPAAHGGRRQVAGRDLGRDPGDAAPARRRHVRRRAVRRGRHRAGLLRRRAAAGDQGRGRARRPQRAAPDQRADRGGDRLRPRQRQRRPLRGLRPRRRHLRHLDPAHDARRVRGRRDRRRHGARRRRHRRRARRLGAGARRRRAARSAGERRAAVDGRARGQGGAVERARRSLFAARSAAREVALRDRRAPSSRRSPRPFVERTHRRGAPGACATRRSPATTIDGVVLVGGSTRMPLVRAAVEAFFGRAPLDQPRSRPGRRARRRAPGRRAGRQRRRGRPAAARRDAAVARARDDGRPGRADHRAQQPDPDRAGAGASRPSRTARRRWRSTSSRASAIWSPTAARSPASSCAASRRWSPARRASRSPSRSMPTAC